MVNTVRKCLLIVSLNISPDIADQIKEFVFQKPKDVHRDKNLSVVKEINESNRWRSENSEHWCFETNTVQFQAVSCSVCGEFLEVGAGGTGRIWCNC